MQYCAKDWFVCICHVAQPSVTLRPPPPEQFHAGKDVVLDAQPSLSMWQADQSLGGGSCGLVYMLDMLDVFIPLLLLQIYCYEFELKVSCAPRM